jgi:two-component system phosphate regulon sensor histidine kinase PhoR
VTRSLFIRIAAGYLLVVAVMTAVALVIAGHAHDAVAGTMVLVAAAAVTAVAFALAILYSYRVARPFKELTDAFRRASAGDFNVRVLPPRRGGMREIADGFNDMVFRTGTMLEELKHQREALNTIITSIREGLMVIDSTGRVVLANDSLRRIAAQTDVAGRFYWEVIREPAFVDLVKSTHAGQPASAEVELGGRTYICSATFLAAAEQTVLTFHDVTEIARSAQLKKDFVTSVSHELRTPLTAIKGFVETMEETATEENRKYLEIVQRHTDRLVNMVVDLLSLSELEEKGTRLELEPVDLHVLVPAVLKLFERPARKKGLALELNADTDLPLVRADPFKLEQVLINLLDNALKYTDRGGVQVSLSRANGSVRIRVSDTGIGIAPEHLPRLFDRFYVVDKSRSRSLGGTGLGLAIVKHIVLLHGGEVAVESTPGVGTRFTLTFPAACPERGRGAISAAQSS